MIAKKSSYFFGEVKNHEILSKQGVFFNTILTVNQKRNCNTKNFT